MWKLYLGLGVAVIIALGIGYQGCKRSWQREQALKAQVEVQKETQEVEDEQRKRETAVERMEPRDILEYWRRLHDNSGSGKTTNPREANPQKR